MAPDLEAPPPQAYIFMLEVKPPSIVPTSARQLWMAALSHWLGQPPFVTRSLREHSVLRLLCPLGTFQERVVPRTDFPSICPLDQFTTAPECSFITSLRAPSLSLARTPGSMGFSTQAIFVTPCPLCPNSLLGLNLPRRAFQRPFPHPSWYCHP